MAGFFRKLFGTKKVETAKESRILDPTIQRTREEFEAAVRAVDLDPNIPEEVELYRKQHIDAPAFLSGQDVVGEGTTQLGSFKPFNPKGAKYDPPVEGGINKG